MESLCRSAPVILECTNGFVSVSAIVSSRHSLARNAPSRNFRTQGCAPWSCPQRLQIVCRSSRIHVSRPREYRSLLLANDHKEKSSSTRHSSWIGRAFTAVAELLANESNEHEADNLQPSVTEKLYPGTEMTLAKTGGSDVLDSSFGTQFGMPLISYGALCLLAGILLSSCSSCLEEGSWLLLGSTTFMAVVAFAYLVSVLTAKLERGVCACCFRSGFLGLRLALSSFWLLKKENMRRMAGLHLGIACSMVVGFSAPFGDVTAAWARPRQLDVPAVEPEVVTVSSTRDVSLARYLQSIGAKFYGAFWCSHCNAQKQMLGREAMKFVDYVECFPEGFGFAEVCDAAHIRAFPTWIIKGRKILGEQTWEDLARASGFELH